MFSWFLSILFLGDFMNMNHTIQVIDQEEVLVLSISYQEEFSFDFLSRKNLRSMQRRITAYLSEAVKNFHGQKVMLMINGVIVSTLLFTNSLMLPSKVEVPKENIEYVYQVPIDVPSIKHEENKETEKEEIKEKQEETQTVTNKSEGNHSTESSQKHTTTNKKTPSNGASSSTSNKNTTTISTPSSKPQTIPSNPPVTSSKPVQEQVDAPVHIGITISLKRASGIVSMSLEDYIIGVVGAEMPASFSKEALKSQAVAARTYALSRIELGGVLSDTNSHQVYKDSSQLKQVWGKDFSMYYNKIKSAVLETQGQVLFYNGTYIDAVYHSTSNGYTENATAVWKNATPYLVSVDSHWDTSASSYLRTVSISSDKIFSTFGVIGDGDIEILERNESGRISSIRVGDQTFTGVEFRNLLGLRSADFDISFQNGSYVITTRGFGHGVGMSQYGANGMAKEGYSYRQILAHYYPGTALVTK